MILIFFGQERLNLVIRLTLSKSTGRRVLTEIGARPRDEETTTEPMKRDQKWMGHFITP